MRLVLPNANDICITHPLIVILMGMLHYASFFISNHFHVNSLNLNYPFFLWNGGNVRCFLHDGNQLTLNSCKYGYWKEINR